MGSVPTVVIAEDDEELRELIQYTLESDDYAVEAFGTGDDCWGRLESGDVPDLVVLDIMMPGMDGTDVLERIRADDRLADVPVVLLSGRGQDSDHVADFEAEVDEYVTKPFSPSELQTLIAGLL